jgi:hypothetical protein
MFYKYTVGDISHLSFYNSVTAHSLLREWQVKLAKLAALTLISAAAFFLFASALII